MSPNPNIQAELEQISPTLAALPRNQVFRVPEGYFDQLPADILLTINPLQNSNVPEGYFDQLPAAIMNRIKSSGLDNADQLPSIFNSIPRREVFSVPEGYFDGLAEEVMNRLPKPAPVVRMASRISVFRYAVAAVLTGLVGLSLFNLFNQKDSETAAYSPVIVAEAREILQTNSYDKVLNSISDEEITGYLQASGEDVNTALLASLSNESNLPDADAYLFDESTLEKLMTELNIDDRSNN
ncbi:MAG TPA: hypothetical protein DHV17_08090 [Chitinophagaceae bacterium]|nr:hypothetical protein [Chitinophagaceae bacterium]HRF26739.1 hypothetical protein [Ferruginibacter sp.]